jgi:hypothetical protein
LNGGHYDCARQKKAYGFETSLRKVLTIARLALFARPVSIAAKKKTPEAGKAVRGLKRFRVAEKNPRCGEYKGQVLRARKSAREKTR